MLLLCYQFVPKITYDENHRQADKPIKTCQQEREKKKKKTLNASLSWFHFCSLLVPYKNVFFYCHKFMLLLCYQFVPKITYALVNDTLYAVKEALEQPNPERILKSRNKNCFEPGWRSTSTAKSLLKILNEKVS